jgi:sugar phosphate isomerase/epimerase
VSAGRPLSRRLGIFARTFRRDTPEAVAAAVAAAGFAMAHWSFAAIGRPALAEGIERETFGRVRAGFDRLGIVIPSVSVTYNLVHPDRDLRRRQTASAVELIARVPSLGADVATLCSGTREPADMWRGHPQNAGPEAWSDLRDTLDVLLDAAARAGVRLGIEPEPGNVVRDAVAAARLLDELGPGAPIGIIFDPANLLTPATIADQRAILTRAIDLLGHRVIGAHAKDIGESGAAAAGQGELDYLLVFRLLARLPPVPLIAQDVDEAGAARVRDDLLRLADEADGDQNLERAARTPAG